MMSLGQTGWKSQLHFLIKVWGPEERSNTKQKRDGEDKDGRRQMRKQEKPKARVQQKESRRDREHETFTESIYMTKLYKYDIILI